MNQLQLAYEIAKTQIGVKEIQGDEHEKKILEFHSATTLKARTDEVPWCAAFVNWCLIVSGLLINRDKMTELLSGVSFSRPTILGFLDSADHFKPKLEIKNEGLVLLPTCSGMARHFQHWGAPTSTPKEGDLVVLTRPGPAYAGHVGFYVSDSLTSINILGGNQNDQVKISSYLKHRLLGYRTFSASGSKVVGLNS